MMRFIRAEFRRIVRQKEIWVVAVVCAAIALFGLIEPLLSPSGGLRFYTFETVLSAERHTLLYTSGLGNVTAVYFVPILAALPNALSYVYDRRNHMNDIIIYRCGTQEYYFGKAIVIAFFAFMISCFPFILNLVYCLVAYPLKDFESASVGVVYRQLGYSWEISNALFKTLYFNHPVLDTLAHIALTGIYGVVMALSTYSISFFTRRNVIVPLIMPLVLSIIVMFILSATGLTSWMIQDYFFTVVMVRNKHLAIIFTVYVVLLFANFACIHIKAKAFRDIC